MGMFDTYRVNWGSKSEDIQTKQLSCLLDYWRVGDRVPLSGYGDSYYGNEHGEPLRLSPDQTFAAFIEQKHVSNMWSLDDVSNRHVVLSHKHGLFCDYAGFKTFSEASSYREAIEKLWTTDDSASALQLRLALFLERNALAKMSVDRALAQIDPAFMDWRTSEQKARNKNDNLSKKEQAWQSFFAYRGPSFHGVSRTQLRKAIESLTQHWADAALDFTAAITPAQPLTSTEDFAINFCHHALRHDRKMNRGLGTPSVSELAKGSMPFHAKKIDDHTLINLLRQGYWEAFEDEFFAYPIGTIDILAKDFISKISLSRFGAAWAASAMTKNPRLAIESLRFGGYEVPILDWFIINMALPPELVEPLCASMPRKCSSRDLPFYCMTPNHAALFPAVFNLDPNAGTETNLNGKSLIDTAISASDPTILSIALNTLMQHQNPSLLQWEHWAELALTVEDKASHLISAYPSRQELNFDNPTSLPTGLQCIAILFNEKPDSFDFSKCKSTTVLAWFAHHERSGIHEGTQSTPPPSATHQPRL